MEKWLDVEKIPEITQLCKIFTRLILWHASDWYFSLIPNSSLIIVVVLYGCQTWQTEEHLTHFSPGWQTGGLSSTFLLKFLSSYFDSLMCYCCWLEWVLGKWSNSPIDFNLDFCDVGSNLIRLHLTCQNVSSDHQIRSHGPISREVWGHVVATNPEEFIWIFHHFMI